MNNTRGYFGIGIYNYKHECNVGSLFRSALSFGASFIFTIGRGYKRQASDTTKTALHVPYLRFASTDDFLNGLPHGCIPINVELSQNARSLPSFCHPLRAAYILGNEANGLPAKLLDRFPTVQIPCTHCLNVSVAGSIILYDRICKTDPSSYSKLGKREYHVN